MNQTAPTSCTLGIRLLVGALVTVLALPSPYATANEKGASQSESWRVKHESGTERILQGTKPFLAVRPERIIVSSRSQARDKVVISIPTAGVDAVTYDTNAEWPDCSKTVSDDAMDSENLPIEMAGCASANLITPPKNFISIAWREDGIQEKVVLEVKRGEYEPLLAELRTVTREEMKNRRGERGWVPRELEADQPTKEPRNVGENKDALYATRAVLVQSTDTLPAPTGEQVVDRVSPSVVLILVGQEGEQASGVGSGLVVRSDGILLTAYHLVKGAPDVQVRFKNGEVYDKVDVIAIDERRDVAALRVAAHGLAALGVAKADEAKPGDTIYVVSNPSGPAWTASSGVLSAFRLADEVPGAGSGFRLLQFTAPVSPGSIGSPLVDAQGRALGIVIGSDQAQNLNFAIPIESVLGLADGTGRIPLGADLGPRLPQRERPPAPAQAAPTAGNEVAIARPAEILRSVRRVYVAGTKTFPPEPLEKKLFEQPEFGTGEFVITENSGAADLVIELDRKEWTWDFTYRLTDPKTGVILGSGKVIAWDGVRAAPGIAKQIIKRLRELSAPPEPKTKKR